MRGLSKREKKKRKVKGELLRQGDKGRRKMHKSMRKCSFHCWTNVELLFVLWTFLQGKTRHNSTVKWLYNFAMGRVLH